MAESKNPAPEAGANTRLEKNKNRKVKKLPSRVQGNTLYSIGFTSEHIEDEDDTEKEDSKERSPPHLIPPFSSLHYSTDNQNTYKMRKPVNKDETAAARIERYHRNSAETAKRQRQERQKAMRNGTMHNRTLAFLIEILKGLGISQKQFGRPLGWSQQNVDYHLRSDDIHYRALQEALKGNGYRIEARFEFHDNEMNSLPEAPFSYRIEGCLQGSHIITPRLPEYLEDCIRRESPVAFIGIAILRSRKTLWAVCKTANIDLSSFRYFMNHDDMRVSFLYRIAAALEANVVWQIHHLD